MDGFFYFSETNIEKPIKCVYSHGAEPKCNEIRKNTTYFSMHTKQTGMETTYTIWKDKTIHAIEEKTASFTEELHKKAETDYLKRLLEKMATHAASPEALLEFQEQMDVLVAAIPTEAGFTDKELRRDFMKKKGKIKNTAAIKHKLVHKGYYRNIWMALGIAIGMPWGVAFGNIALGLPIGLAIGVAIGISLDSKAAKEGRVV